MKIALWVSSICLLAFEFQDDAVNFYQRKPSSVSFKGEFVKLIVLFSFIYDLLHASLLGSLVAHLMVRLCSPGEVLMLCGLSCRRSI